MSNETETNKSEFPPPYVFRDRRAGRADPEDVTTRAERFAKMRRESLYQGRDEGEEHRLNSVANVRTAMHRWKFGEDPRDEDAHPDSGYNYYHIDAPEKPHVEPDPHKELNGPDAGVRCFQCKSTNYRIVDERTPEQMIETQDDLRWAVANNRPIDASRAPGALLLFCPNCKHKAQMATNVVEILRRRQEEAKG